jgi:hypothetical protein
VLTDFEGLTTSSKTTFVENQKYEHGSRLKIKINILFHEEDSQTQTNEVRYSKMSWTHLLVLFQ